MSRKRSRKSRGRHLIRVVEQSKDNFPDSVKDYIPASVSITRSVRIAYISFLVLLLTLLVTLLTTNEFELFIQQPIRLPIFGKEIPSIAFMFLAPLLVVIAQAGLMMRLVSLRRVLTVCCYDHEGKLRDLAVRRRVKNMLPSFDVALAFSPVHLGKTERYLRASMAILLLGIFPFILILSFAVANLPLGAKLLHYWFLGLAVISMVVPIFGLFWPTTSRRPNDLSQFKTAIKISIFGAILVFPFFLFVYTPNGRDYSEWNAMEKWWYPNPDTYVSMFKRFNLPEYLNGMSTIGVIAPKKEEKSIFGMFYRSRNWKIGVKQHVSLNESDGAPLNLPENTKEERETFNEYLRKITDRKKYILPQRLIHRSEIRNLNADGALLFDTYILHSLIGNSSFVGTTFHGNNWGNSIITSTDLRATTFQNSHIVDVLLNSVNLDRSKFLRSSLIGSEYELSADSDILFVRGNVHSNFFHNLDNYSLSLTLENSRFIGNRLSLMAGSELRVRNSLIVLNQDNFTTRFDAYTLGDRTSKIELNDLEYDFSDQTTTSSSEELEFKVVRFKNGNVFIKNSGFDTGFIAHQAAFKDSQCWLNESSRCRGFKSKALVKGDTAAKYKTLKKGYKTGIIMAGTGRMGANEASIGLQVLCQLALYGDELSDIDRVALCPLMYGTKSGKVLRDKYVKLGAPEPMEVSETFNSSETVDNTVNLICVNEDLIDKFAIMYSVVSQDDLIARSNPVIACESYFKNLNSPY